MYLAVDIGGTKTLIARFTKDGDLQESLKFPTPKSYDEFLKVLADNVARITTKPWQLCCVAAPGVIDREKDIVTAYGNLSWENTPIVKDLEKVVDCDVLLENDAKLAALSEARLLKPVPHKVLYVTISTGIGTALVIDSDLDITSGDAGGTAMFFEHNGKVVDWESFASGKAIVKRFNKPASEINDSHVWNIISHDIAMGLIDLHAALNPDIIIIGGGVGAHFSKFAGSLRKALKEYETPLVKAPKVVGAKHAEAAVIYGCYQLMKDRIKSQVPVH